MPASNRSILGALLAALFLAGPSTAGSSALSEPPAPSPAAVSPFSLGPADYGWAGAGLGLLAWGQIRYFDMEPADPAEHHRDDLWAFDRWAAGNYSEAAAITSDILLFPLLAAPLAISAWETGPWNSRSGGGWTPFITESVIYLEALVLSSSLNLLVDSTQVHPRPLVYGSDAPESDKTKGEASGSFYSGHANGSFVAATYIAYTYPLRHPEFRHKGWLWAGALGYAATVAGLRVGAGKHFPSDIVVGSAAGAFFGWLLPRMHLKTAGGTYGLELRALPGPDGAHGALTLRF